jgi:hypothetical protein
LSFSSSPSFRVFKAAVATTRPPRVPRCWGTPPIFLPLLFKVEDGETTTNDVDKDDEDDDAFRAAVAMPTSRDATLLFFFALKSVEAAAVDDAKTVDMMSFFLPYYTRFLFKKRAQEKRKSLFFSLSLSNISTPAMRRIKSSRGDERETELLSLSLSKQKKRREESAAQ